MNIQSFVSSQTHSHMKKGALSVQRRGEWPWACLGGRSDPFSALFSAPASIMEKIVQKAAFTSTNLKFSDSPTPSLILTLPNLFSYILKRISRQKHKRQIWNEIQCATENTNWLPPPTPPKAVWQVRLSASKARKFSLDPCYSSC